MQWLKKQWRGEVPLKKVFWVYGILYSLIASCVFVGILAATILIGSRLGLIERERGLFLAREGMYVGLAFLLSPYLVWCLFSVIIASFKIQNFFLKSAVRTFSVLIIFFLLRGMINCALHPVAPPITKIDENVRSQIEECWDVPPNLTTEQQIPVDILIEMNPDRTIRKTQVVDQSRLDRDANFKLIADSALQALKKPACTRLNLPNNNYEVWKEIDFTFDPRDLPPGP